MRRPDGGAVHHRGLPARARRAVSADAKPRGSRACRGRRRHRAARPIALSGPPSPGKHCGERKNRPICHGDRSGVGALEMTEEGAPMTAITTPSIGPTIMDFTGIQFVHADLAICLLGTFLLPYITPPHTRPPNNK